MSEVKQERQRTLRQNRAMHLMLTQLADELNSHGKTMMRVLDKTADIAWTDWSTKEFLLRPFIRAMFGKESTTDLTTKELTLATDAMLDHVAKVTGVALDFPSVDQIINQQRINEDQTRRK